MVQTVTSYDNATVGSGSVVNEVLYVYDDFGQVEWLLQEASGAVNGSTSPKVGYEYADGSANTVRLQKLIYPNGRELTYGYGSSAGIDDALSRVKSLVDDDVSSTHLADYAYLGLGTFVECDYTEPDVKWTMVDLAGSNDPDTGDVYTGFDRFGRVKDNRWRDYGSSTDVDRLKYGYDRASNRIWRENVVATSLGKRFDELYSYDDVHRLKDMQRGTLNGGRTAVTNETFAECWSLDTTGNWSKYLQDDDGDATWDLIQSRTANPVNEITNISETAGPAWATPVYDAVGNITSIPQPSDPTQAYRGTWDAWNRLVKLEEPNGLGGWRSLQENEYDGQAWRIARKTYTAGSLEQTRRYLFTSNWKAVEETVFDGSTFTAERQYIYGRRYIDDIVLRDRGADGSGSLVERLYSIQDANWNAVALISNAGSVSLRYAYSAYGIDIVLSDAFAPTSGEELAWNRRFASYELDNTCIYFVRTRFYHALAGVWLGRDGARYFDGPSLYALYSPINATDPTGMVICACTCADLGSGGYATTDVFWAVSNKACTWLCEARSWSSTAGGQSCAADFTTYALLASLCMGDPNPKTCWEQVVNFAEGIIAADNSALGFFSWGTIEERGLGSYGGRCHYWSANFNENIDDLIYRKVNCMNVVITLDASEQWGDHNINVCKNSNTGACVVVDDGFWGDTGKIYDPCKVNPPLMGSEGRAQWQAVLQMCGCGGGGPTIPAPTTGQ